ncbi:MAG: hypothetical protein JNM17_30820 [Archangium sp.]|nr:hypothetical protein [Archangium sp.]
MSRRELTWYQKAFIKTSRALAGMSIGYYVTFDEELVRQRGIAGFLKWGKATQAAYDDIERVLGGERAHLVAAFASFFNGCDYCAWGHLFATNLLFFERTTRLFPIDEQEVHDLMRKGDSAVLTELAGLLKAEFPEELRLLMRQQELRSGGAATPATEEDRVLLKSIGLFEWVNECSITVNAPAPPMDPIARKKKLLEAYAAARKPGRDAREAAKPARKPATAE